MKTFSNCPKCKLPMLNEDLVGFDYRRKDITNYWRLSCKNIDHEIEAYTDPDNSFSLCLDRLRITIMSPSQKYALWSFPKNTLVILSHNSFPSSAMIASFPQELKLPFFIPDLKNYDKLINKLRTYIAFS